MKDPSMRRTTAVVAAVLVFASAALADHDPLVEDLAAIQGKWTTQVAGPNGKALTAIKEIKGNTETYSLVQGAEVVHKRDVEFRLSRLDNKVRMFTVTRVVYLLGPDQGRSFEINRSYLYKIEGDTFFEVGGLLVDGNLTDDPTQLLRWQRISEPGGDADSRMVRQNTLRVQTLGAGNQGRDVARLRAYDAIGSPSCSGDGRWVAFDAIKIAARDWVSPSECQIVRLDGTGLRKLTDGATPRWSPDGERLVFMREFGPDPARDDGVWVINRDGTGERRLGPGRWPDWSPDGARIAYSLGGPARGGARPQSQIFIMQADGSGARLLGEGDCPSWSPDGLRIACCYVKSAGAVPEIRVVDVETGRSIAIGQGWYRAQWSPDGKSLVCNGTVGRQDVMVRLSADGPAQTPERLLPGTENGASPGFAGDAGTIVFTQQRPRIASGDPPHTFDGRYELATIDLTVVYLVPRDRKPLADWRERVDYFMKRIAAFHRRESGGRSALRIHLHPEPLVARGTAQEIRGNDPDQTFDNSTQEARTALGWPGKPDGFPILLVLSEINWRELDDFQRTIQVDGVAQFEGSVNEEGRHFPGARSGGARATYRPELGIGYGLVSADGWRVPYSGSDCVIYHEGLGHTVGLPHPEPADGSVMGQGQYRYWLNQSWIEAAQKRALGYSDSLATGASAPGGEAAAADLFTVFTALPSPIVPRPSDPVQLKLNWPAGARLRALKVRIQTDLYGPWRTVPVDSPDVPPPVVDLGSFARPTPVSYRVDATLQDGQSVELWGYFKVEPLEQPRDAALQTNAMYFALFAEAR
jgi:Tol biopolymer transport system component